MTIADHCPRCGEDERTDWTSTIDKQQSGGITYRVETIRCACGCIVGEFADPLVGGAV